MGDGPHLIRDRYEVIRVLGAGSAGRTLLCTDRRDGRQVAVKELHFEHAKDWKYLELFEREAKTLAMLDHPGIPKVFDFFQESGHETTLYIVQEFIDGPSLQHRMESGPMLGQREIFDLALGVLDVLDYLHGRAPPILHRDIKPSNVLVRHDGRPALIDFGGVCVGWRPPGTAGTTVVGTFGYMPPEQLVGQGGPTSDLYALGATLLHLVTGRPPHEFPFDSGRIEVPDNLPIDPSLARLIEALLRPSPRDRPRTSGAARQILIGQTAHSVVSLDASPDPAARGPAILPVTPPRRIIVASGSEPRFVDMGDPPRDPKGEFKDVYRNLIHPLFPARLLWSGAEHAFWIAIAGVISAVSVGTAPLTYAWGVRKRKQRYDPLFRFGVFTRGIIRAVDKREVFATFKYEFTAGDALYLATIDYPSEMARSWGEGDHVAVLYDAEDPSRCCFVYR